MVFQGSNVASLGGQFAAQSKIPATFSVKIFCLCVLMGIADAGHPFVLLAVEVKKAERHATRQLWVFRPNNHIGSMFTEAGVKDQYLRVSEAAAKRHWTFWHNHLEKGCIHGKVCSRYDLVWPTIHLLWPTAALQQA